MRASIPALALVACMGAREAGAQEIQRNFVGSVQLDYLSIPTETVADDIALDGATAELSLKVGVDFSENLSSNVKVCFACHGFEVGVALLRPARRRRAQLPRRALHAVVRRLSGAPRPGQPPDQRQAAALRHGPHAAHPRLEHEHLARAVGGQRARDQRLALLRRAQPDRLRASTPSAARAPRPTRSTSTTSSRARRRLYYIDNNSRPTVGGRLSGTLGFTYDGAPQPGRVRHDRHLRPGQRAHLLAGRRRSGAADRPVHPASRVPVAPDRDVARPRSGQPVPLRPRRGRRVRPLLHQGRLLHRAGDPARRRRPGRPLGRPAAVRQHARHQRAAQRERHAALHGALSYRIKAATRLKLSAEYYDSSDFDDEVALHIGIASPF